MRSIVTSMFLAVLSALLLIGPGCNQARTGTGTGNVIFIHPDGAGAAHWAALRVWQAGPDGQINWDKLPAMATYTEHTSDSLSPTSNAGATIHAYGVKAPRRSFGTDGDNPIVDARGRSTSIAAQAKRAGMSVALVNSGIHPEPGTACFLSSVPKRNMFDRIVVQLIDSDADILLGAGEANFLPKGVRGRHGVGEREDNRNMIEEAEAAGYTIVYNRDELAAAAASTEKLLGIFAHGQSFNDNTEEHNAEHHLPLYWPDAPTLGEMTAKALEILQAKGRRFLLVVEEEGTDNFSNKNNAAGTLEALRRSDEAIGIASRFVDRHPQTLLLTAADSNAGGIGYIGVDDDSNEAPEKLPATSKNGAPVDGVAGTGSAPFVAKPDKSGRVMRFAIVWATNADMAGGVIARGKGLNSHLVTGIVDNAEITAIMRQTLFGSPNGPAE